MLLADEAPCIVTATKGLRGQPTRVYKSRDETQSREILPRFRFGFVCCRKNCFQSRTSILHPSNNIPPERTQQSNST